MDRGHASIVFCQPLIGDLISDIFLADDWTTALVPLCSDSEAALAQLEQERPKLIATEFEPAYGESLVRLVRAVRSSERLGHVPILLSRYRGDSVARVAPVLEAGPWAIMTRPYSVDDFLLVADYLVSPRYRAREADLPGNLTPSVVWLGG